MGVSFFDFELETQWFEVRDFSVTFREKSVSRVRLWVACVDLSDFELSGLELRSI